MMSYLRIFNADVDVEEMKQSDSKDKYVHCICERKTVHLSLESKEYDLCEDELEALLFIQMLQKKVESNHILQSSNPSGSPSIIRTSDLFSQPGKNQRKKT